MKQIYVRGLRERKEEGFILNEETRQKLKDGGATNIDTKAEAEIARTIYYDYSTQSIKYIDRTDNKVGAVSHIALELGQKPLLEMHTHPNERWPSINDYVKLFMGLPNERERISNAIMVVCPKTQVLALPTDLTPILDPEKAIELVQKWSMKEQEIIDAETQPHQKKLYRIIEATMRVQEKLIDRLGFVD